MKSITVSLPDGSTRTFDAGTTAQQIAASIGRRLEEAAVAAKVDGKVVDLTQPLDKDCSIAILTRDSKEGLEVIRHSTAHLLAMAVKELYPETQVTIGPVTEDGFYYDFDRPTQFSPEDLPKIEKRMEEIASRKLDLKRQEWKKEEVVQKFKAMKEDFKVEIIQDLPEGIFSTYSQGDWVDLCRGPHVPNTARLGKFKLLSIAGAYWRGDEKNKMLQRIYGTAFATQKELDEYIKRIEEARKRDHRKLGPEIGLFTFLPIAPAMPFYLPKGALLYDLIGRFIREQMRPWGYDEVMCPQLMSSDLWKTSGHWDNYRENMFVTGSEEEHNVMCLKPMNCPGHAALFASTKHSYRDLPIRYAEFSKLHRNERAGVTHGLFRTRSFSQDDAHIFCTEDQILEEAKACIEHTQHIYKILGFNEFEVKLATRPEKFIGTIENFDKATNTLAQALKEKGIAFEYLEGEGAFYGPKIEFHIKDCLKRFWQCGTVQLDFGLPERFQLEYTDSESRGRRPVMIHRAIFGSFERFMGILIEHYAGHFPLWLAPTQAVVINVAIDQEGYAKEVTNGLIGMGMRAETDIRNEKLGYKIREAQLKKIPLMIVLGNQEMDTRTLSLRRSNGETTNGLSLDQFQRIVEAELKPGGANH
jgi:threonyl-tRNA synthetase